VSPATSPAERRRVVVTVTDVAQDPGNAAGLARIGRGDDDPRLRRGVAVRKRGLRTDLRASPCPPRLRGDPV